MPSTSPRVTALRDKTAPSLRVARQITPCVVAGLAKGITIVCAPRLAWHHLTQQRGLCRDINRPWTPPPERTLYDGERRPPPAPQLVPADAGQYGHRHPDLSPLAGRGAGHRATALATSIPVCRLLRGHRQELLSGCRSAGHPARGERPDRCGQRGDLGKGPFWHQRQ